MRYSAKTFLNFLNESHHDVEAIWQMKSDVSFFLTNVVRLLGGEFVREYQLANAFGLDKPCVLKTYTLNGKKFGLLNYSEMHRTQFFFLADPSEIDGLLSTDWEQEVELEDDKRVFTLKRRAVNGNMFVDLFPNTSQATVTRTLQTAIGINDLVARKFQFGWRATQKTKRVAVDKNVLLMQEEIKKLLGFGCEFTSSDEMRKNGTLEFKIPVWAVTERNSWFVPRTEYAKHDLEYVGRFVIGRKDSVIRWWDFHSKSSIRLSWSQGDDLTTLGHYKGAIEKLIYIMSNSEYYHKGGRHNRRLVFDKFKFKEGWTVDALDVQRVEDQISNTIDDLW